MCDLWFVILRLVVTSYIIHLTVYAGEFWHLGLLTLRWTKYSHSPAMDVGPCPEILILLHHKFIQPISFYLFIYLLIYLDLSVRNLLTWRSWYRLPNLFYRKAPISNLTELSEKIQSKKNISRCLFLVFLSLYFTFPLPIFLFLSVYLYPLPLCLLQFWDSHRLLRY